MWLIHSNCIPCLTFEEISGSDTLATAGTVFSASPAAGQQQNHNDIMWQDHEEKVNRSLAMVSPLAARYMHECAPSHIDTIGAGF